MVAAANLLDRPSAPLNMTTTTRRLESDHSDNKSKFMNVSNTQTPGSRATCAGKSIGGAGQQQLGRGNKSHQLVKQTTLQENSSPVDDDSSRTSGQQVTRTAKTFKRTIVTKTTTTTRPTVTRRYHHQSLSQLPISTTTILSQPHVHLAHQIHQNSTNNHLLQPQHSQLSSAISLRRLTVCGARDCRSPIVAFNCRPSSITQQLESQQQQVRQLSKPIPCATVTSPSSSSLLALQSAADSRRSRTKASVAATISGVRQTAAQRHSINRQRPNADAISHIKLASFSVSEIANNKSNKTVASNLESAQTLSSATTNSRVRQGTLYARRQSHMTQASKPTVESMGADEIPSSQQPMVARMRVLGANQRRINAAKDLRADLGEDGGKLEASRKIGWQSAKTAGKFSLTSSASSLTALTVVKRPRHNPKCEDIDSYNHPNQAISNCRLNSLSPARSIRPNSFKPTTKTAAATAFRLSAIRRPIPYGLSSHRGSSSSLGKATGRKVYLSTHRNSCGSTDSGSGSSCYSTSLGSDSVDNHQRGDKIIGCRRSNSSGSIYDECSSSGGIGSSHSSISGSCDDKAALYEGGGSSSGISERSLSGGADRSSSGSVRIGTHFDIVNHPKLPSQRHRKSPDLPCAVDAPTLVMSSANVSNAPTRTGTLSCKSQHKSTNTTDTVTTPPSPENKQAQSSIGNRVHDDSFEPGNYLMGQVGAGDVNLESSIENCTENNQPPFNSQRNSSTTTDRIYNGHRKPLQFDEHITSEHPTSAPIDNNLIDVTTVGVDEELGSRKENLKPEKSHVENLPLLDAGPMISSASSLDCDTHMVKAVEKAIMISNDGNDLSLPIDHSGYHKPASNDNNPVIGEDNFRRRLSAPVVLKVTPKATDTRKTVAMAFKEPLGLHQSGNFDPAQQIITTDHYTIAEIKAVEDIPIKDESISDYYYIEARPFARGKFAQVKRCIHRKTNECFAAKCIKKRRRTVDIRHEILLEIEALKLSYYTDHIVRLYEVFETSSEMILILEMANGGELQRVLDDEEIIDERTVKRMVRQILEGLVHLHDHEIAHLDIKPQNLLLTKSFPDGDIKLCDFGISRRITKDCEIREICGTPDYVAPEILRYDPISLATDMWSLGVLTYVLLSGYSPFGSENKQQTFCNITQATLDFPDEIFDKISKEAIDFIQRLIVKEPSKRLTCREARDHAWLSQ